MRAPVRAAVSAADRAVFGPGGDAAPSRRRAPRRLSIGLFTYSTLPRGSVVHTAHLADALGSAGHDVTVYALDKDGRGFFRPLRAAALRLVPAGPAPASTAELVTQRAGELASYLCAGRPAHDVLHAEDCLTASGLLAARARGLGLPLARTVHHVERFEDPTLLRCQERSIREADLLLTVSEAAERDVLRGFGLPAAIVGNGVDGARFRCHSARYVRSCPQSRFESLSRCNRYGRDGALKNEM